MQTILNNNTRLLQDKQAGRAGIAYELSKQNNIGHVKVRRDGLRIVAILGNYYMAMILSCQYILLNE